MSNEYEDNKKLVRAVEELVEASVAKRNRRKHIVNEELHKAEREEQNAERLARSLRESRSKLQAAENEIYRLNAVDHASYGAEAKLNGAECEIEMLRHENKTLKRRVATLANAGNYLVDQFAKFNTRVNNDVRRAAADKRYDNEGPMCLKD